MPFRVPTKGKVAHETSVACIMWEVKGHLGSLLKEASWDCHMVDNRLGKENSHEPKGALVFLI